MGVLQNFRSFGYGYESVTQPPEVPGIVARAYRTYRSSGYGYKCPTEHTKVPSKGNTRENAHPLGGEIDLKRRTSSNLHVWHVLTGPMSPRQSVVALREL